MEPQDFDERFQQHEEMIQALARMFTAQLEMNQRLTLAIERIDRTLAHVEITQARMETLFARVFHQEDNGQHA